MKKLAYSAVVECYIGMEALTINEGTFLVDFNVRTGTIKPLNPKRVLHTLANEVVHIWPSIQHRTTLSFSPRMGKLIAKGRGNFELHVFEN